MTSRPEWLHTGDEAMLRLFSVSMPRAGHHVAEMVLGQLLGAKFAYCEFYTIRNCCKQVPCSRMAAIAASGAVAFMQKSHDHNLTDPIAAAFNGVLVQVREPEARALSNYELDLATVGPPHSNAYQRYWLGMEAAYTTGFIRKWCTSGDDRFLTLHYEELVADPVSYYRRIFTRFGLPSRYFDESKIALAQSVSSGNKKPFRERDIRASAHFDPDNLSDFQRLVVRAAAGLGYQANPQLMRGGTSPAVALIAEARQRMIEKDSDGALVALESYLMLADAHVFGRRLRAQILLSQGKPEAAETELQAVIAGEAGHPRAYIDLAELQAQRGQPAAVQATLERCLANALDPGRASEWILAAFTDPAVTALARGHAARPAVTREDVVAAFRFILGRDPEEDRVIEAHQNVASATELRDILLRSTEFAEKYRKLVSEPAMDRGR